MPPKYPGPDERLTLITSDAFVLSNDFVVTNTPTTRTYHWRLSWAIGAPDGFYRKMMVVNGLFPGPLIEANQGDTIIIHVKNDLDQGAGIHFHGINQIGSLWADGVPGVTQCPIPSGGSFTYKFTIQEQSGTFFWHSHMGNTMADGLTGPLIVHSLRDPYLPGKDFDYERVMMVSDWVHQTSEEIIADTFARPTNQSISDLVPASYLINGAGVYNCTNAPKNARCEKRSPPEIHVLPNKKYRFRIISHSSEAHFKISIDNHPLQIIQCDDTPVVGPSGIHRVPIANGERYDFVIDTSNGKDGDAFWIRAPFCSQNALPGFPAPGGLAILRYVKEGSIPGHQQPTTSDWSVPPLTEGNSCPDLTSNDFVPVQKIDAPKTVQSSWILNSVLGSLLNAEKVPVFAWFLNNVTFQDYIYNPMLLQLRKGLTLNDSAVAHTVFPQSSGADIVINNKDATIDHPFHLHGKPFFIIARGSGALTADQYAALPSTFFNTTNPLRRDTLVVTRKSYAILRILTDEPGVFALHCHMGWHLAHGKLAAVVVQPDAIPKLALPDEAAHVCPIITSYHANQSSD
ncbi:multicopper oxidase [Hydnum rufescens UP504]|uniref:Multicopper oxidase n=1 Tax=Hydnum rufescens UP504 TaxID=1448309 RepID=A0A9P6DP08_9AGAM|nr:multicopper oxidase [Hydnum rufescens UP504]